ncbi:MAG: phosphotransferase [Syntrophorhabdaceae bacterium]|nr:phosphotransferase [Syntrophorhabdaceae bacterium]
MTPEAHLLAVRGALPAMMPSSLAESAEIVPLAGDASSRAYYRVSFPLAFPSAVFPSSVVVMAYPDDVAPGEELPFLNVHRYLRAAGIPVPDVLRHEPEARLLFLEDAGDTTLEDAVQKHGTTACLPVYEQCIEVLIRIQTDGTRALDGSAIPARLSFDLAKFGEEIDFFFEHAVREFGEIPLSDSEERAIEDLFIPFLERIVSLPHVLAHRDYHSRNVMVLGNAPNAPGKSDLRVLDYQDARMGSVFYDLASLLRDSYVTLAEEQEEHLRYVWRHLASKDLLRAAGDPGAFAELLDAAALQRNVKAIGTFGNQAHNRGKKLYLRFIPPTLARLRKNFSVNPSMRPLAGKLLPLLEAIAEKALSEMNAQEGIIS